MDESVRRQLRLSAWSGVCAQLRAAAATSGSQTGSDWARLMSAVSEKLTGQAPPESDEELHRRILQSSAAVSIISTVAYAHAMASGRPPAVARRIFEEVRRFCDQDLPRTQEEVSSRLQQGVGLTVAISSICHEDTMRTPW